MERERGGRPRYPGVLTPAEQRVLDELREGGTNAEIAARLGLSRETVKTHIASMLSKLDLSNRHELAGWQPEPPRRRARGWFGLLVRPAAGLGAATGVGALIVILAVIIGASRDDAESIDVPLAETEFEVMSCSSGVAVTNPDTNTELVADCEALLGLRDTLRGTGKLNWTAGKPMSEWMGVTVSGTPQRVTALNLSDLGLDGELSGLLGNLTGLTDLRLDGNALTGMIPSKLVLLTNLTIVSLADNSFEECAPPVLRKAATNDIASTGLDDCGASTDLWSASGVLAPGTYHFRHWGPVRSGEKHLVIDVPRGLSLRFDGVVKAIRRLVPGRTPSANPRSNTAILFEETVTGAFYHFDAKYGGEWSRSVDEIPVSVRDNYEELFDLLAESWWFEVQP